MSDTVILLGAGFSHGSGIPLMGGFVERMWEFAVKKSSQGKPLSGTDIEIFDRAIQVRNELDGYHGRATFDDRNIEDILSILSFNALGGGRADHEKLRAMNRAIARTIDLSCSVTHPGVDIKDGPRVVESGPETYRNFWTALFRLKEEGYLIPTIITFNYDLVLERSFLQVLIGTSYDEYKKKAPFQNVRLRYYYEPFPGIASSVQYVTYTHHRGRGLEQVGGTKLQQIEFDKAQNPLDIDILKLHGSLNFPNKRSQQNSGKHNFAEALDESFILPPIFNKLSSIAPNGMWRVALQRLRSAKNVIFVGYSLPRTDIYMQYFLKAALGPNVDLNRIFVFDPILFSGTQAGHDMRARYEECFSPQLRNRIGFNPDPERGKRIREGAGTAEHFVYLLGNDPKSIVF
jgi:hypothetical protein